MEKNLLRKQKIENAKIKANKRKHQALSGEGMSSPSISNQQEYSLARQPLYDITNDSCRRRASRRHILKENRLKNISSKSQSESSNKSTASLSGVASALNYQHLVFHEQAKDSNNRATPSHSATDFSSRTTPSLSSFASSSDYQHTVFPEQVYVDLGDPVYTCQHCNALMWYDERVDKRSVSSPPKFSLCCMHGKISLAPSPLPPQELIDLFFKGDTISKNFIELIRIYNSMFAFTSMGGKIDTSINKGRGPPIYRLHGQNIHRIGSLLPPDGASPKFQQMYIHDTENENTNRIKSCSARSTSPSTATRTPRDDIVEIIKIMLNKYNPYVQILRLAKDRFTESNFTGDLKLRLISERTTNSQTHNLPTCSEVAALFIGDIDDHLKPRDIVVETKAKELKRISELHPAYLALQYPILFPFEEDGYHIDIQLKKISTTSEHPRTKISMREFIAYKLMERSNNPSLLMYARKLFQQFIVDGLTMIEAERIGYLKLNQKTLRADKYVNISASAEKGNSDSSMCGRRIVLPSTFTGGARYMQEKYLDAMAVCQHYGYPDFFITFTCNPKWPEVIRFLQPRSLHSEDRPNILARIFKMKLDSLIVDIKKNNFLGPAAAVIYTIEFQKRGLPHAHILLFLQRGEKLATTEDIDKVICSEIPDKIKNPVLYEVIKEIMIHGPCGLANTNSPCMNNGLCTKRFPKEFNNSTYVNKDGFPVYKRRDDGRLVEKNGICLDNRFVIPYNPVLLLKYRAHINVEWCNQTRAIKYLFKYINKGNDRVTVEMTHSATVNSATDGSSSSSTKVIDEIKRFYDCRYISPCEAAWRTFGFEIHYSSISIQRLSFHLPGEHNIVYDDDDNVDDVLNKDANQTSQFLEWMKLNGSNQDAKELCYVQFPSSFVWNKKGKQWNPRKRNVSVGRIHHVYPSAGELFYLRILVNRVKGPTCYEDIRTVEGITYPTYKDACYALGLLEDDQEYIDGIVEASQWGTAYYMRKLFASLLMSESLSKPCHVWVETWTILSEDVLYMQRRIRESPAYEMTDEQIQNQTLLEIERLLRINGSTLRNFPSMPFPDNNNFPTTINRLIQDELSYDKDACAKEHYSLLARLTGEQRKVFDRIMASVDTNSGGVYFVYGFGGTGKTFIWKTLSTFIRSRGEIVINVASSGMAALLLQGGRTAHSRFSIPIQVNETSTCSFTTDCELSALLLKAKLIIWDEAPMLHKHCYEALDRSLRDIARASNLSNSDKPFGGKTITFGGDFRQILPVIPKGTREQIVQASLTSSFLWESCEVLELTKNMRLTVESDRSEADQIKEFSDWILKLGDGKLSEPNDGEVVIDIPEEMLLLDSLHPIDSIANAIYPSLIHHLQEEYFFKERAILCPTNDDVDEVNNHIMEKLPGEIKEYLSSDKICNSDYAVARDANISTEFLNAIKCSGVPNHILRLKVGVPIMLIRNIDQKYGLCNGTRMQVTQLGTHIIEAKVLTGNNAGTKVYLPRMVLTPTDAKLPFRFQRRQFPIIPCFGMTINKSQGQSLSHVGIFLPRPVFAHGQLYVAVSRVKSKGGLKIIIIDEKGNRMKKTKNVVYKEVLQNL